MQFINLTPHTLNIHTDDDPLNLEPSGAIARVSISYEPSGDVQGVPVTWAVYGDVTGLPPKEAGKVYIVSGLVEARVRRSDVYAPGEHVRDENGKPVGCKGLKQTP